MQNKTSLKLALGTTLAAGVALGTAAVADNPFAADKLASGYLQLAENKASGEMKCGAGMCGSSPKKAGEGKCGNANADMECPADSDKDGKVTKDEFVSYHEKLFDESDANHDGALDADERKALHQKMWEGKCGSKLPDAADDKAEAKEEAKEESATKDK